MKDSLDVVIFNDSVTMRASLRAVLESAGMTIVDERASGRDAAAVVEAGNPDIVIMDVIMPEVDGYEATRAIMAECPRPILMVSAALDPRDSEVIFRALSAGAVHMTEPPSPGRHDITTAAFIHLVRTVAGAGRTPPAASGPAQPALPANSASPSAAEALPFDVVGIAASAGGPAALLHLLGGLRATVMPPMLIVQHLARGFAATYGTWLADATGYPVRVAETGIVAEPGVAYMPPEDRHLGIDRQRRLIVSAEPAIGRFRPSATYLLRSVALLGSRAIGVVLSGMGDDGAEGAAALASAGGIVIAQDRDSSAVWGMPQAAVNRGAVTEQVGITEMATWLRKRMIS